MYRLYSFVEKDMSSVFNRVEWAFYVNVQILTGGLIRQTGRGFDSVSRHFVSISFIFGATKFASRIARSVPTVHTNHEIRRQAK